MKDNKLKHVHQTSWGVSTRLIGAIIMVHGDDSGLVFPPKVAPTQLMIIPIQQHKEGVLDKAYEIRDRLKDICRVKVDDSDKMPGWKFSEHEMRGVPYRLEIGPKDIENNQCVLVRRDTREKTFVGLDELETRIPELLQEMQDALLEKAIAARDEKIYTAATFEEFENTIKEKPGFVKAMWCGCEECEKKIKELTTATSRCIPFEQEEISDKCVVCGKPAKHMLYWGKAY